MMRFVAACLLGLLCGNAFAGSWFGINNRAFPNTIGQCPVTVGTLTLRATPTRTTGISPLLVFYDATATTDSSLVGAMTAFQDVTYTWNFGDNGASGSATWAYGSNPNVNSRNTATGGVGAHLYVTAGNDTNYTVTVTATNGVNTASCLLPTVTAYDPSGVNGFPGSATTCVAQSTAPVAGVGGCPTGAAVLTTTSFNTALGTPFGNGKRVLFKCGDTFTGDNATLGAVTWSIDQYGTGCTGSNRPIFSDTTNGNQILGFGGSAGDGRISNIDLEGNGSGARGIWDTVFNVGGFIKVVYQITLSNLLSNGTSESFGFAQGAQWGLINSVQANESTIGTFFNFNGNNPPYSGNTVNNLDYSAAIGNSLDGTGAINDSQGREVFRVSTCRMCVISNNTIKNANPVGAVLKFHNGNTNNSCAGNSFGACFPCTVNATFATTTCWTGIYTELTEISDNWFGGTSGANLVETSPENANDDERIRNIVFERNTLDATTGAQGGRLIIVSAVNETLRDNVFKMGFGSTFYPIYGAQLAQRAMEPAPTALEIYNNTCYNPATQSSQVCIAITGASGFGTPAANSFAKNNLYFSSATSTTVTDIGTGNTVSNNTVTPTVNPSFTNGGGSFALISDFKPTANYTGGASVRVDYDALGVPWSPTWDFGAVHH